MKQVLEDMVRKPNVKLIWITKQYFFKHTTQREKKQGREGGASDAASLFFATVKQTKLFAKYYYFGEDGTGIEVIEAGE